jgi:hypothetical protein
LFVFVFVFVLLFVKSAARMNGAYYNTAYHCSYCNGHMRSDTAAAPLPCMYRGPRLTIRPPQVPVPSRSHFAGLARAEALLRKALTYSRGADYWYW